MKKKFRNPIMDIAVFDNAVETTASAQGTNEDDAKASFGEGSNVTIKSVSELKEHLIF